MSAPNVTVCPPDPVVGMTFQDCIRIGDSIGDSSCLCCGRVTEVYWGGCRAILVYPPYSSKSGQLADIVYSVSGWRTNTRNHSGPKR